MMKSITSKKYPAAISAITFTCVDVIGASSKALPTKSSMVCATLFPPDLPLGRHVTQLAWVRNLPASMKERLGPATRITERTPVVARALVLALELQDIEASIGIGQIHYALRVDKAVVRLDDLRSTRARVEHALGVWRHVIADLARLKGI